MLLPHEIAEEYLAEEKEVLTPSGWKRVKTVYKTIPLPVWELCTPTRVLRCSGHHLVRSYRQSGDTEYRCHRVETLQEGDWVETEDGAELISAVRPTGETEEMYDLTIDSEEGLFYSSGIVSHNSTTLVARQLIMSHLIPGYKSLYVCPYFDQLKTYADRYLEMEQAFRGSVGTQNKYDKLYANGSKVDMHYALTDANKIRGKTVTECVIDEAQNMDPNLIPEVLYTMTTSKLATTIYAGTALSVDTLLELEWQRSSQGMWHVRAGDGRRWLNMYDKDVLQAVCDNPDGPRCPYTKRKLVVTDGCFVHANEAAFNAGAVGVHVPQCIIPDFANDPVMWGQIYKKIKTQDFKKTMQECFGIAVAEGARELTEADLRKMCVIRETPEELLKRAKTGYYRTIISGCDWGGSDYNPVHKTKTSYTVHCIIGLAPDGFVDILHWKRYSGMDYTEIAEDIVHNHNMWNGKAIASDFGVGMAYNTEIRKRIPFDKHFVMSYVGPRSAPLSEPKGDHMYNQLSLNRTEAITRVITDIKTEDPLMIRSRPWDAVQEYLTDFLNMFRVPADLPGGETTFKYLRVATKADDAMHAFTFAYTLMSLYKGEPIVKDLALERRIKQVLGGSAARAANEFMHEAFGPTNFVISG